MSGFCWGPARHAGGRGFESADRAADVHESRRPLPTILFYRHEFPVSVGPVATRLATMTLRYQLLAAIVTVASDWNPMAYCPLASVTTTVSGGSGNPSATGVTVTVAEFCPAGIVTLVPTLA